DADLPLLCFDSLCEHQHLHSFPTRRSSDLEKLRGIDGPTGKDDLFLRPDLLLAAIFKIGDTNSTCSFKQDARRQRFRPDGEIGRSEEHTSELQSQSNLVCRLLLEKK